MKFLKYLGGQPSAQLTLLLLILVLLAACDHISHDEKKPASSELSLRGAVIIPAQEVADFSLPATTGTDFSLSAQRGKVVLLYFGYLNCPDVCPDTAARLTRAYQDLGEPADQVSLVFVTVDPERDTLDRMKIFLAAFHADFIGLRGEDSQLQPIMAELNATAFPDPPQDPNSDFYTVTHTASVFLIDQEGKLLEQFTYGTAYQDIAHDVREVLKQD